METSFPTLLSLPGRQLLRCLALLLVLPFTACDDDSATATTTIRPKGPKPDWGPTIKPEMQTVIEALDSLSKGVSLTTLTPNRRA
ncbi:hypothetical protein [Hymenobacter volaticus]|uniref:Uncharacterized protein n=1 Tax=Hymenobacter volaticus TaxID=2932254 RepID=A0ABY4GG18_9BACT|nr:hypothetical protein [Hymenobacter volaticus]UOQ69776.1 hypothetical protein MUN86_29630 [Hymenobacter volaticus]